MQVFVYIKPGTKHRDAVVEIEGGSLIVYTKAPAVEGRANLAAIQLIASHFGVSKTKVKLVRGHTAKYKIFEIEK